MNICFFDHLFLNSASNLCMDISMTVQIDTSSTTKTSETLRSMTTVSSNRKSFESPKTFDGGDPECSKAGYIVATVLLIIGVMVQLPFSINWIKKRRNGSKHL